MLIRRPRLPKRIPFWKYPQSVENDYVIYMRKMISSWKDVLKNTILANLERIVSEAYVSRPENSLRVDDWAADLKNIANLFRLQLTENSFTQHSSESARSIFTRVSQANSKEWHKITESVFGIPLLQTEPWIMNTMQSFVNNNVSLITETKDRVISQVENVITQGVNQGLRHETIKKQLLEGTNLQKGVFKKVETRAELIARDQVAKLNGQLAGLRQAEIGVDRYFWNTSLDERVRPTHSAMEGRLCSWTNASVYSNDGGETWLSRSSIGGVELHPGQDYQCRCSASPDFTSLEDAELANLFAE